MSCGCNNFPNCGCDSGCGNGEGNRPNRSCCNPCGDPATNTPTCENLPSQIENFTKSFFGEVTKTEVDGQVAWSLPCSLDTGLPNNPRLEGEGLACYFLRLFEDGIIGLTGPQGETGEAGTNGRNAYTVTLASYNQPSAGDPNVQVVTLANPAIVAGLTIFIAGSGYFFVNDTDGNGTLFLTLIQPVSGAPAVITAGKIVIASGPQGASITGPQGPQGVPGEQGTPGESFTATNGQFNSPGGTNDSPGVVYSVVDFTSSTAEVLLANRGTYMLTATVGLLGKATVLPGDILEVKLRDTTINADLAGSEQGQSNVEDIERTQIVINCIYTTDSVNHTVSLFAKCSTAGAIDVVAARTTLTFVRLE